MVLLALRRVIFTSTRLELTNRVLYFAGGEAELPTVPEPKKVKRTVETTSESIKETAEGARRRTKKVVE
jgi:predicted butyrate kinase (DUF1464 family)